MRPELVAGLSIGAVGVGIMATLAVSGYRFAYAVALVGMLVALTLAATLLRRRTATP